MAADHRTAELALNRDEQAPESARQEPLREWWQYSFFQAVRLLQSTHEDAAPVGHRGPAEEEALRFRAHANLAFPSRDVQSVERLSREGANFPRYRMTVNFLGLYGPASPLPAFYTEEILSAEPEDCPHRQFLDLFHHRLVSLFYRSWTKYRYYATYQRSAGDPVSGRIFALLGLRDPRVRGSEGINWIRLLSYGGLLSMRSHSADVVAGVLSHYFHGLRVRVQQFIERRVRIHETQRARLGQRACSLGRDVVLGERVADRAGKFRLVLGPLDFSQFLAHLPDGAHHDALRELVRFMVTDQLAFDVELRLRRAEMPELRLERDGPCRLGWSSWLGEPPRAKDGLVLLSG